MKRLQSHPAIGQGAPILAPALPLDTVRVTGGPLKQAQDLTAAYLLALEPDRMMAYYRTRAGLPAKAEGYGGWDGDGRNLTGHIAGHYLSAVSLMYAATGDVRFQERARYIVDEMAEVQAQYPDGYLSGLADGRERFAEVSRGDIRSGGFDLNGLWAPWYVLHKTYAGLRDAYRYAGCFNALAIEIRFAEWAEEILSGLDGEQTQKMLNTEFGGMNEVLADLAVDTGDARWLTLSERFEHHAVVDPLARGENVLPGLHGNTQIPKLIGSLSRYLAAGDQKDYDAADFFWETVVDHHTFATGGHGKDEYFGPADSLAERIDGRTAESCNIYNMLKMTRTLFSLRPDVKYADFHERALFNHVLGSIDLTDGRVCYMTPVGRAVQHEYQDPFHDFTCCVGTGMESHALHGDGIYYASDSHLWINLFVPSTATWDQMRAVIRMETDFPAGDQMIITISLPSPKHFTLSLRRPSWASDAFSARVEDPSAEPGKENAGYMEWTREWRDGDCIAVAFQKPLRLEKSPDNPHRAALMWGPLVLAGDLGPEEQETYPPIPVFTTDGVPPASWLQPKEDAPGVFTATSANGDAVTLMPFYRVGRRTYSAYWDIYTAKEWELKAGEIRLEERRQRELDAVTLAYVQPGEMQPERDFHQEGEESYPVRVQGRAGRRAGKWFSFAISLETAAAFHIVVTFNSEERMRSSCELSIDGRVIGSHTIERSRPGSEIGAFYDVAFAVPDSETTAKAPFVIKFSATEGSETPAVFGMRVVRGSSALLD